MFEIFDLPSHRRHFPGSMLQRVWPTLKKYSLYILFKTLIIIEHKVGHTRSIYLTIVSHSQKVIYDSVC